MADESRAGRRDVRDDEGALRDLFADPLSLGEPPPPPERDLVEQAMDQARAEIHARDWIDLTTQVLVLRFFVPMLELIMGNLLPAHSREGNDERDDG